MPLSTLSQPNQWLNILSIADQSAMHSGGLTTLIGFMMTDQYICGGSVGDSKLYCLTSSDAQPSELTSSQSKNPPVGSGQACFVPFSALLDIGSRVLAMSDGVWKYCGYHAINQALKLRQADHVFEYLKKATLERNGDKFPDDFSLILADAE